MQSAKDEKCLENYIIPFTLYKSNTEQPTYFQINTSKKESTTDMDLRQIKLKFKLNGFSQQNKRSMLLFQKGQEIQIKSSRFEDGNKFLNVF